MSSLASRKAARKPAAPNRTRARKSRIWKKHPQGWYVEDKSCTRALLPVEQPQGVVWDPACGLGNVVTTVLEAGGEAFGTDLVRRVDPDAPWFRRAVDFIGPIAPDETADEIWCNPPFFESKGAEAFARRALQLARRKVCLFVDQRFRSSLARADGLFSEHPPAREWIVLPRPSCPPGDYLEKGGKAQGGTANYCWLVWDLTAPAEPSWRTGFARRPKG